jgi:hypothetical protein
LDVRQTTRIATHVQLLRAMNERTRRTMLRFRGAAVESYVLMCECALPTCNEMVHVSATAYEHVRSDRSWYMVRPKHIYPDLETVVERHDEHWIVQGVAG